MSDECDIEGCDKPRQTRGWCMKHYTRFKRYGSPTAPRPARPPAPDVACRIDGCDELSKYRGQRLCMKHYQRIWAHGAPELPAKPEMRDVILSGIAIDANGCWIWQGSISSHGYGRVGSEYAHRAAHESFKGPIPAGYDIDHLCRVHPCCNPDHIEAVPRRINFLRGEHPTAVAHRRLYGGVR